MIATVSMGVAMAFCLLVLSCLLLTAALLRSREASLNSFQESISSLDPSTPNWTRHHREKASFHASSTWVGGANGAGGSGFIKKKY